jgi:uncharacterized protein YqhQ
MSLVGALIAWAIQVTIFLLLLRISPLTSVHGAEHMVVRAIEEGEDLTLTKSFLSSLGETVDAAQRFLALIVVVVIVLLSWRRLGAGLQRWATTRRPSDRQLESAILVGESLLERVRSRPGARVKWHRRVWNSGFPQVLVGFLVIAGVVEGLAEVWALLIA